MVKRSTVPARTLRWAIGAKLVWSAAVATWRELPTVRPLARFNLAALAGRGGMKSKTT